MQNRKNNTPSPIRIIFFGMLTAFLMMSYQNCGKSGGQNSGSSTFPSQHVEISPSVATMSQAQDQSYIFYPTDPTNPFAWPSYVYNVNLGTGAVLKVQPGQPTVALCLSSEWQTQLQNLMKTSSICLEQFAPPPPGTQCTDDESVPHTQITVNSVTYGLGGFSRCPTQGYEICQDQLANYKQVLAQFLSVADSMSCAP